VSGSGGSEREVKIPNLEAMNVDEFMEQGFFEAMDGEDDADDAEVRFGFFRPESRSSAPCFWSVSLNTIR
jgi:hypothetical protein